MGRSPDMPQRKVILLNQQKGVCPWCCLRFREGDILEEDHILARALGGKDEYKNLQLLHGHCHDAKTAFDLSYIRENSYKEFLKCINLNFRLRKMTKAFIYGSCSDFLTTRYWLQFLALL